MSERPQDFKLWATVSAHPARRRGFDYQGGAVSHCALPPIPADQADRSRRLNCRLIEDDVRGSFQAIAEMAGYTAALLRLDPADREQARNASGIAREIEDQARAIRLAIAMPVVDQDDDV
jgi:hypothetical protein